MNYLLYFFQIFLIQYTSAQMFTVGGNNYIPNINNGNKPTAANLVNAFGNGPFANKGLSGSNIQSNLAKAKASLNANKILAQEVVEVSAQNNNVADVVEIPIDVTDTADIPCNDSGNEAAVPKFANIVQAPRQYGIEFSSDALEVQGGVQVNGKMPFSANVEVKGTVPAQGKGAVSYKCEKMSKDGN